jgi:hypothetical protein
LLSLTPRALINLYKHEILLEKVLLEALIVRAKIPVAASFPICVDSKLRTSFSRRLRNGASTDYTVRRLALPYVQRGLDACQVRCSTEVIAAIAGPPLVRLQLFVKVKIDGTKSGPDLEHFATSQANVFLFRLHAHRG